MMTETIFTLTGITWMVLFFHSLNQLGKTYDEKVQVRYAYVEKLNSYGGN
jgi:hypothetical protein